MMIRVEEELVITNSLGMHLRPAQRFVQTVLKFQCDVHVQKGDQRVNAKSIMGLLTLAAACGTRLIIICEGDDADDALSAVRVLVEAGFGEE